MHYLYKNTVRVLPLAMVDDLIGISKCGLDSIELNTFMNIQIELKKLKFHVPDKDGKTKCHKMHIGARDNICSTLTVHNTLMSNVTEDTYLGDIISSDGRNTKNVTSRISKGIGIITQINHLLEMVSLGHHYMEIALLFREALFLNGILTNCEIWYGFSSSEVKEFENLDLNLLRKILQVPISTPQEAFYLELGIIPVGIIIKARRINYLHYLVTRSESEMLHKSFLKQWFEPCRGDWTEKVKEDLAEFDIPCDWEFIKSKSRDSFKRLVKRKAHECALKTLTEKQQKHSKMEKLVYTEIKAQKYLTLENIRVEQVRNIFRYRVRMAPYEENFKGDREHVICPLCGNHWDSQSMSFQCKYLKEKVEIGCDMTDIYTDDITLDTARTITDMLRARKEKLEKE